VGLMEFRVDGGGLYRTQDMPAVSMSMSIYCQPSATHAAPGSKEKGAKTWSSVSWFLCFVFGWTLPGNPFYTERKNSPCNAKKKNILDMSFLFTFILRYKEQFNEKCI